VFGGLIMNFRFAPALAASLLLTGGIVSAVPITGVLNFTGGVNVTTTAINFLPPAGDGAIFVTPLAQEGSFEAVEGTFGAIKDLDRTVYPVGPVFLEDFISLDGDISFTLTEILPGTFDSTECGAPPDSSGQTCTPPPIMGLGTSPFNLSNQSASSSIASFEVRGYFVDGASGDQTAASGIFTTQFNIPYQAVLQQLQSTGSVQANSYSATFSAAGGEVPEPSALALGMIGLGLIAVRRLWVSKN
jgi:hypothetical protein